LSQEDQAFFQNIPVAGEEMEKKENQREVGTLAGQGRKDG
jgi:hypothetical protein